MFCRFMKGLGAQSYMIRKWKSVNCLNKYMKRNPHVATPLSGVMSFEKLLFHSELIKCAQNIKQKLFNTINWKENIINGSNCFIKSGEQWII